MTAFVTMWSGQVVSLVGSSMTRFALMYWAYQQTGLATSLALMGLFGFGPTVLLSPLAGALVDRLDRRLMMMLSDLAAGLATVAILILYGTGHLEIWHLYAAGAFASAFEAFQFPAYSAAESTMVPKQHYGRANGMIQMAESGSAILAPVLAGILLGTVGIVGILAVDIVTFLVAIGALLLVHVPRPRETEAGRRGRGSLWQESLYGLRYIVQRPSLLGLQLALFSANLTGNLSGAVLPALILARTASNATIMGSVFSAGAVGGVAGGLLMSIWGGPRNRVLGLLGSMFLMGILHIVPMGLGRSLPVWAAAAVCGSLLLNILNGCSQALWQAKVAPDVQGRVFASRRMIAQISAPVAMLAAGPLADRLFEPAMQAGGTLAPVFGGIVGTGPGAGMGLMFVFAGILHSTMTLFFYAIPAVRGAQHILPDHDQDAVPVAGSGV